MQAVIADHGVVFPLNRPVMSRAWATCASCSPREPAWRLGWQWPMQLWPLPRRLSRCTRRQGQQAWRVSLSLTAPSPASINVGCDGAHRRARPAAKWEEGSRRSVVSLAAPPWAIVWAPHCRRCGAPAGEAAPLQLCKPSRGPAGLRQMTRPCHIWTRRRGTGVRCGLAGGGFCQPRTGLSLYRCATDVATAERMEVRP